MTTDNNTLNSDDLSKLQDWYAQYASMGNGNGSSGYQQFSSAPPTVSANGMNFGFQGMQHQDEGGTYWTPSTGTVEASDPNDANYAYSVDPQSGALSHYKIDKGDASFFGGVAKDLGNAAAPLAALYLAGTGLAAAGAGSAGGIGGSGFAAGTAGAEAGTGAAGSLAGETLSKAALDGTTAFGANSAPGAFDLATAGADGASTGALTATGAGGTGSVGGTGAGGYATLPDIPDVSPLTNSVSDISPLQDLGSVASDVPWEQGFSGTEALTGSQAASGASEFAAPATSAAQDAGALTQTDPSLLTQANSSNALGASDAAYGSMPSATSQLPTWDNVVSEARKMLGVKQDASLGDWMKKLLPVANAVYGLAGGYKPKGYLTPAQARANVMAHPELNTFTPQQQTAADYYFNTPTATFHSQRKPYGLAHGGQLPRGALGLVGGAEGGQADNVPANLSPGEFVWDADTVSALGDGNNAAGARVLEQARQNIREHKRSAPKHAIPPQARSVEDYMPKGALSHMHGAEQ